MVEPHFWDNSSTAKQITQQATMLKNQIEEYTNLQKKIEDVEVLYEFGQKEEEYLGEAEKVLQQVIKDLDALELQLLFQGKYDASNVILSLHAGAGGTESQDWTNMLLRMYTRWAEQQGLV